jgi:hypothetical protein
MHYLTAWRIVVPIRYLSIYLALLKNVLSILHLQTISAECNKGILYSIKSVNSVSAYLNSLFSIANIFIILGKTEMTFFSSTKVPFEENLFSWILDNSEFNL